MLTLNYTCDPENVNGTILLVFEETSIDNPYLTPLNFSLKNSISGDEIWSGTFVNPGDWSSFPFGFHSEAEVHDFFGNLVFRWKWDPVLHGDPIHKFFNAWAVKNKGSFGIAIGTHDGTSGEWVDPVRNGNLEALLIEASDKQFKSLVQNYKAFDHVYTYKSLVTPFGGESTFFELGDGHVNSVKIEHVQNYSDEFNSPIREIRMPSISIGDLFKNLEVSKKIKWLHLDTEGLDADLISALLDQKIVLPEIIIYESLNLSEIEQNDLLNKLSSVGYRTFVYGWNTLAQRTKSDG